MRNAQDWSNVSTRCTVRSTVALILLFSVALPLAAVASAFPPLLNAQQVSEGSGTRHTCVIVAGAARCFGNNDYGQLGNGGYIDESQPFPVYGLNSGVTAMAEGAYHTCAIVNGGVKCWGRNADGELGNGSTNDSGIPVSVQGLANVIAISAGLYHTCAVVSGGSVRCWGWNSNGQLGDGTLNATNSGSPSTVSGITTGATAISSGSYHSCALVSGAVKCWGYNGHGELGNGSVADSHVPTAISSLSSGVIAIGAGTFHTCAAIGAGSVRCWGVNTSGQLGDNTTTSTLTNPPVSVSGITSGATAVVGGGYHSCAIVNGAAKCWGYNMFGQLGTGTLTDSHVAVAVSGLASGVSMITAGLDTTCALVTISAQKFTQCWGINFDGEAGLGDDVFHVTPYAIASLATGATALAQGSYALHSCAIVSGGAMCWGDNETGELGDGTLIDRSTPVAVSGVNSQVTAISDGGYHTCAVVNGAVKCWGANGAGQLGDGTAVNRPTAVKPIASNATAVSTGAAHSCALVGTNVKCWGNNVDGELGNGSVAGSQTPTAVQGLAGNVLAISSGVAHTCAVIQGGTVQCWGYNSNGQLGDGTVTSTLNHNPVTVTGISNATAIAAGGYHTCAMTGSGVKCWGDGQVGQLGNGMLADSHTPVAVTGLTTGVGTLVGGNNFSCVLKSAAVSCWGAAYSISGVGTILLLTTPQPMPGLGANVTALGTGGTHVCAIVSGAVQCLGTNYFGEIGDGRSVFLETPGTVVLGDLIFADGLDGY